MPSPSAAVNIDQKFDEKNAVQDKRLEELNSMLSDSHEELSVNLSTLERRADVRDGNQDQRMDELRANGMTVEPASDALKTAMRQATASMEGEFVKANPAAAPLLDAYHKAVGH